MVTDDVRHVRFFDRAVDFGEVEEAFVALREARTLLDRQHPIEFHRDEHRVDHLVFTVAWVDVAALDVDFGSSGVEVFILQLANFAAVHSVGVFCTEFFHIELHHTATDFLVRGEPNFDLAMLEVGVFHHILCGIHDFGHARFVIGTE